VPSSPEPQNRRILFVSHACYLDDSNGAATASRSLVQALHRHGFHLDIDPAVWLAKRGYSAEERGGGGSVFDARGFHTDDPPHFRLTVNGVPVTVHRSPSTRPHDPGDIERAEFLQLLKTTLDRFRPDVLIGYGGSLLAQATFAIARARGIVTVFTLHNFGYAHRSAFADIDAVLVRSSGPVLDANHLQ
jgi:hypothetical protein